MDQVVKQLHPMYVIICMIEILMVLGFSQHWMIVQCHNELLFLIRKMWTPALNFRRHPQVGLYVFSSNEVALVIVRKGSANGIVVLTNPLQAGDKVFQGGADKWIIRNINHLERTFLVDDVQTGFRKRVIGFLV